MSKGTVLLTIYNLVRQNSTAMPISEAVDLAIDTCIRNGILREFLERNRKDVRAVSIYEFDKKKYLADVTVHTGVYAYTPERQGESGE